MLDKLKLKSHRKAAGLTGEQLGKAVGVSQSVISQYESGLKTPSLEIYGRIADKLGVTMDALRNKEA